MPLWVIVLLIALAILAAAIFYTIPLYWWAKQESFLKHRAGASLLPSSRGEVEYATLGEGVPILMMHGAGGSYRQGLLLGQLVDAGRFQIIGVSRPGYRGTALDAAPTFEEQADLAVELLDHLRIKKAAVLGISAGGTPAFQFALRHPERCLGLILLSAALNVPGGFRFVPIVPLMFQLFTAFDYPIWLFMRLPLRAKTAPFGWIDPERFRDARFQRLFLDIFDEQFPGSAWRAGVVNDINQYGKHDDLPFEDLRVPGLVIHGTNDNAVPYAVGHNAAERIPGADLMTIERGTHFAVATHWREIGARIEEFLL